MSEALWTLRGPITLIGHPFATVGMGEQLRSYISACQSAQIPIKVVDVFRHSSRSDLEHRKLVEPLEVESPPEGLRIFHINGDEVVRVLEAFEERGGSLRNGYNVIVPAWELPKYPAPWAKELRKFDEVWALSHFIEGSFAAAGIRSTFVGQPVEVPLGYFLPRKYFGIRESAFVLLSFLDLSSYSSRKNPEGVLQLFDTLKRCRELEDIQLVVKAKNADQDAEEWIKPLRSKAAGVHFISKPMSALETRSLINCCDCFVSLHRSEGFGRCTGEAMFLGRLALATSWSGNLDHMTRDNSLLVDHRPVRIRKGQYPFGQGQMWAEPSIDHALQLLDPVVGDPQLARSIATMGRRDVRLSHSFRAVGIRILDRIRQIGAEIDQRRARRRPSGAARAPATPLNGHASLVVEGSPQSPLAGERRAMDVWLAAGTIDMRKGFAVLARLAERRLAIDSSFGQLFVFRSRMGKVQVLRWDLSGLCLFNRRVDGRKMVWYGSADVRDTLDTTELSALLAEVDWNHPLRTKRASPGTRCHRMPRDRRKTSNRMVVPAIANLRLWHSDARLSPERCITEPSVRRRPR